MATLEREPATFGLVEGKLAEHTSHALVDPLVDLVGEEAVEVRRRAQLGRRHGGHRRHGEHCRPALSRFDELLGALADAPQELERLLVGHREGQPVELPDLAVEDPARRSPAGSRPRREQHVQRRLAEEAGERAFLDESVAAQALHRLGGHRRHPLAQPVLGHRRERALQLALGRIAGGGRVEGLGEPEGEHLIGVHPDVVEDPRPPRGSSRSASNGRFAGSSPRRGAVRAAAAPGPSSVAA